MTNNFKAADLIGKELIVGNGVAKYIIKSVEGDTWRCIFHRDGVKDLELPMKAASLLKMVEEKRVAWAEAPTETKPESTKDETAKPEPKPEPTKAETKDETDDIEEVDAEEIEEPKPTPKPAKPKLRIVTGKIVKEKVRQPIEEPEDEEPTEPIEDEDEPEPETETEEEVEETPKPKAKVRKRTAKGKYIFATYTTKRGKTAGKICGLSEDEPAYQRAGEIHASHTWERKDGKRVYTLLFGPRYTDAAKEVCRALNEGADFDELLDIVETNTEALAQKRAEMKAEYLEKKAKREAERKAAKTAKAAAKGAKGEELYTEAQVKERIRAAFAMVAKALKINIDDLEPIIKVA